MLATATVAFLLLGCGSPDASHAVPVVAPPPVIVVPAGLSSKQTADGVVAKTIAAIKRDEALLGRDLGPIRILRVELVPAGQTF
jgi:hypothetical protein